MAQSSAQPRRGLPLWNPGASQPTVSAVNREPIPAASTSSQKEGHPVLRKGRSKSLPGGFKLAESDPFVVHVRTGPTFPPVPDQFPLTTSLLRSILLRPTVAPQASPLPATPTRRRLVSLPPASPSPPPSPSPKRYHPTSPLLFPPTPPPSAPRRRDTTTGSPLRRSGSQVSLPPLPKTIPSPTPPTGRSLRPSIVRVPLTPHPNGARRRLLSEPSPPRPKSASRLVIKRPPPTLTTLPLPLLTLILTYTIHSLPLIHHPAFLSPSSSAAITSPTRQTARERAWRPFTLCLVSKLIRSVSMKLLYFRVVLGPSAGWTPTFGRPMSRAEKFARTVGRNAGIGGLVRVLEGTARKEELLVCVPAAEKDGKRKKGKVAGEGGGEEWVPKAALKSLAVVLGSCKNLSVLSLVEPDATQPTMDAMSSPPSSSSDDDDNKVLERIHPSDRRVRPRPRRHRRTPALTKPPPAPPLAALVPPNPAVVSLLQPHLTSLTRLQSYTHHPALPLAILPSAGWPNLSILSVPVLLPRSPTPALPEGWTLPPEYLPSVIQTIQPFLPHVERLVLRLTKPTLAQLPPRVATSSARTTTSPKKLDLLKGSATPLDPFLSALTFLDRLLPDGPLARVVLELEGPVLSAAEEVSLVAFGIRVRGVLGPGRVAFVEEEEEKQKGRSRLSRVGRSEGVNDLKGIEEEEAVVGRETARLERKVVALLGREGSGEGDEVEEHWAPDEIVGWRARVVRPKTWAGIGRLGAG